jgi:hypothetical protein
MFRYGLNLNIEKRIECSKQEKGEWEVASRKRQNTSLGIAGKKIVCSGF